MGPPILALACFFHESEYELERSLNIDDCVKLNQTYFWQSLNGSEAARGGIAQWMNFR